MKAEWKRQSSPRGGSRGSTGCAEGTGIRRFPVLGVLGILLLAEAAFGQDVLTWHNDTQRTGQYTSETVLTPANVHSGSFGKQFAYSVDGAIFSQPLYKAGVPINGTTHNVIFVATANNSLYAFDADSNAGANANPLWHVNYGTPYNGPGGTWGICGTPVIDPGTGTIYFLARTSVNNNSVHTLHALDISSGAERMGGPKQIQISVPGNGDGSNGGTIPFSTCANQQMQRTGLLLNSGSVFFGWGSPNDVSPYHGWLVGLSASNIQTQVGVFNSTPGGGQAGIWMAGGGASTDANGNIYVTTGNGTLSAQNGGSDYGECVIKLSSPSLSVMDWFAPFDWQNLNNGDVDLGTGAAVILPDQGGAHPHVLVMMGKSGMVYVIDRDNMGHVTANAPNRSVQEFDAGLGGYWSTAAYWNGHVYLKGDGGGPVKSYTVSNSTLTAAAQSTVTWNQGGGGGGSATPSISANGSSNGILWAIEGGNPAVLHAFDALSLNELWNSNQSAADHPGGYVNFTLPTIAAGRVYCPSSGQLCVYGTSGATGPAITKEPANQTVVVGSTATFTVTAGGTSPLTYQWQKSTNGGTSWTNVGTNAATYTTPATVAGDTGTLFRVIVSNSVGTVTSTSATLTVTTSATAPTITTPPANQTVTAGQTATFTVAASGTAPLSYQWQRSNNGGTTWTNVGTNASSYTTGATAAADSGALFRVVVSNSAGSATSATATLTVTTGGGALPSPWQALDVGAVGVAGDASYSSGSFDVCGSGADIWNSPDAFHFVYQSLTGDGSITAHVASITNTNPWAKAGVMIRETLDPTSRFVDMVVTPGNGTAFQYRTTAGGNGASIAGPAVTAPTWVKLVRTGSTLQGYVSPDGSTWTLAGTTTITMASSVFIGLAVTAHDTTQLNCSAFDSLSLAGGSGGGGGGGGGGGTGAGGSGATASTSTSTSLPKVWGGCGLLGTEACLPLALLWALRRRLRGSRNRSNILLED